MSAVADLLNILKLTPVEKKLFKGESQDLGFERIFGGQVLGQALSAASQTIVQNAKDKQRIAHSLHAYFLRPGDAHKPVIYDVETLRDGNSFSARRVTAIQNGEPLLSMDASFQAIETGFEHQQAMPLDIPPPEKLKNDTQLWQKIKETIPEKLKQRAFAPKPIEIRPVAPLDPFNPQATQAVQHIWFKAGNSLPDDAMLHQALLAYASDFRLCTTSLRPHGYNYMHPKIQLASLDHAMWFYHPFRFDDWLLYTMSSEVGTSNRGFNRGQIFNRQGQLVATVAQECLMRLHK